MAGDSAGSVDYVADRGIHQQNKNLVANYSSLIEQLDQVIEDLKEHIWD